MNNYELLYILPANMAGKEIKTVFLEIEKNILKIGGKKLETLLDHPFLIKAETSKEEDSKELKDLPVVKRKMAYLVKKNKFGFYCLFNFSSEPENIKEIETYLRMNDGVLRHLIIQANPMNKEERKELEKLFTRKRSEQEKEKAKEKKERKDEKKEKRESEKNKKEAKKPQELKIEKLPKEELEEKEEKTVEKLKETKKETKETKEKDIKKDDHRETTEEKTNSSKKKKMKLEDLEDKLDEILEDTNI